MVRPVQCNVNTRFLQLRVKAYSQQGRLGRGSHRSEVDACCCCPVAACPSPRARGRASCGPCRRWSGLDVRRARRARRSSCSPTAMACSSALPSTQSASFSSASSCSLGDARNTCSFSFVFQSPRPTNTVPVWRKAALSTAAVDAKSALFWSRHTTTKHPCSSSSKRSEAGAPERATREIVRPSSHAPSNSTKPEKRHACMTEWLAGDRVEAQRKSNANITSNK